MSASQNTLQEEISEPTVYYARGSKSAIDLHNLFVAPFHELLQYQLLIRNIISRDLKVRYKRSVLGIVWTVLAPLMSMMVLWVVFTYAFKVRVPNFAVFLLSGIITWNLFSQSSIAGCQSILANAGLIQKIRLPRVVFPVSVVVNNAVNFAFAFVALLIVTGITGAAYHWTILLTPLIIIPILIFSTGWAMLVSSLSVFFRDLQYILEVFLAAAFYLTPILFKPEDIPPRYNWAISLNPIAKFVHLFRTVAYTGQVPSIATYLVALAMSVGMFLLGWITFHRLQRKFVYWL